jgi:hypothetical protein
MIKSKSRSHRSKLFCMFVRLSLVFIWCITLYLSIPLITVPWDLVKYTYFILLFYPPYLPYLPYLPTLPNLPTFKIVLWKILRFCTVLFPRILFPSMIQESSKKYETRGYGLPYKLRNPASDTVGTYYWRTINID